MKLKIYDSSKDGVYTFESVLKHHKEFDKKTSYSMADGIVWVAEKGTKEEIRKRHDELKKYIDKFDKVILETSDYQIRSVLDSHRYPKLARFQLLNLALYYYKK